MRKALDAQLVSLAHRILQMKDKSEVAGLYREAKALYETLAMLHFYQTQFEHVPVQPDFATWEAHVIEAHQVPMAAAPAEIPDAEPVEAAVTVVELAETAPAEEVVENKAPVAQPVDTSTSSVTAVEAPASTILFDLVLPTIAPDADIVPKEEEVIENEAPAAVTEPAEVAPVVTSAAALIEANVADSVAEPVEAVEAKSLFEEALGVSFEEPIFVRADATPSPVSPTPEPIATPESEAPAALFELPEETPAVTNMAADTLTGSASTAGTLAGYNPFEAPIQPVKRSITIGLNDRIGFVKHLFADSNEDFNRVLSQLNSFNSWEEAQDFIANFVKPDYDQWKGLEDYESRFLEVIEKKFR